MTIYNFFKNLLGIKDQDNTNNFHQDNFNRNNNDAYRNRVWNEEDGNPFRDNMRDPSDGVHHFSVFTDPLEMQRYFEQQMDDMMRSFGGFFGNHSSEDWSPFGFGGFGHWEDMFAPSIEQPPDEYQALPAPPNNGSLRDHYLKPGYEQPRDNHQDDSRKDSDIDGKLDMGSLDSILGSKRPQQQIVPRQPNQPAPHSSYFYGKSISSRTVQRPDGSVEYHRTTRDHEGNEEHVVTRQVGDKQYSVTTRRTKDGKEERIEDMVNIDEKDVNKFISDWQQPNVPIQGPSHDDPNRYFPFDKFFRR